MSRDVYSMAEPGISSTDNFFSSEEQVGYKKSKGPCGLSSKALIGIIVLVCVVALALGLGLGLGLKGDEEEEAFVGCPKFSKSSSRFSRRPHASGTRWLHEQECTIPSDQTCPERDGPAPVILVSLDGFRAEYLHRNVTPVLSKLAQCGSYTPKLRPVFPSKTFPNHYTIVTGLYTESHGIIDNFMYDKSLKQTFTLAGEIKNNPRWWHGEPIWNTAKKNGLRVASMFWPGSEAPIQGMYPDFCYEFDGSLAFGDRVDEVLHWMGLPAAERPDFITLYFNQPDSAGHTYGPYHAMLNSNLTNVDSFVGQLMDGLMDMGMDKCTNVIVLADHGMAPMDCFARVVRVDGLDPSQTFIYDGVLARVTGDYIINADGDIEEQENGATPEEILEHFKCGSYNNTQDWYTRAQQKHDLPVRLHYMKSSRIEDVIVTVQDEWRVVAQEGDWCSPGDHGYDNKYESMQALFLAYGPSIKEDFVADPFENIEVYNLIADLLGVESAPNNGTRGALSQLLRNPPTLPSPAPGVNYGSCPYPGDGEEVISRRNSSTCTCEGIPDPDGLDSRLNLAEETITTLTSEHLPLGRPSLNSGDFCQLTQEDYITGYHKERKMPAWAAYHLTSTSDAPADLDDNCVRRDIRLGNSDASDCAHFQGDDITWGFLFPSALSSPDVAAYDAHISSNQVPMYQGFKDGVWRFVTELLEEYREKYNDVVVLTGPAFDHDHDGLADNVPPISSSLDIPNYYFVTLLRCDSGNVTHCNEQLQTMSVILPHKPSLDYCQTYQLSAHFDYLKEHVARVKDIEHLTGMVMYKDLPEDQRARVITHLDLDLWERKAWMDTKECPDISTPSCPSGYNATHPPLILISLDGFRYDYLQRNLSKTIEKLSTCGVSTPYLRSVYPTLTFPNHYSLVTGLYPDFNGMVDNSMYDMDLEMPFFLGSPNSFNKSWWGGEPIWNTVQKHGKTAVTMFWPGSDVPIQDMYPNDYYIYDGDVPYDYRVDQVLKWLNGSAGAIPDLVVLYMDKTDKAGHDGGPVSVEVDEAIAYVDKQLNNMMDGLQRAGLASCINILITSDHGMTDISCDRGVQLNDYLDSGDLNDKLYVYQGGAGRIGTKYNRNGDDYFPLPEDEQADPATVVKDVECKSENLAIYLNKDFPVRFHYASNPRTEQIQLKLRDTWQVNRFSPWCPILGQHGWDPTFDTMKAFFLAYGPSFKDQYSREAFDSIELNNLMAEILGIERVPNNGTEGSLYDILRNEPAQPPVVPSKNYEECPYPSDMEEYYARANDTDCECSLTPSEIEAANSRLDLSQNDKDTVIANQMPQGEPFLVSHQEGIDVTQDVCKLVQEDYVSGFSHELGMPLWSSFTLNRDQVDESIAIPSCLRPDVRLETGISSMCQDFESLGQDYTYQHLFPPRLASSNTSVLDAGLQSNIVPMLKTFVSVIWNEVIDLMKQWTRQHENIHFHVGPVFDYDSDGVADSVDAINQTNVNNSVPIASHFYMAALWCEKDSCQDMDYTTSAFIIPHRSNTTNCMSFEEYLHDNRVRIRDIELITNLQMLTANNTTQASKARTRFPMEGLNLS